MNLPLPKETREYLGDNKNRLLQTGNLGLLFTKYVYSWQKDWQMEEKDSKKVRDDISKMHSDGKHLLSVNERHRAVVEGLQASNYHVESFNAATDSRLIIGLGSESVIETGMTLHPLYGFPYLPASGLKGLARAYAELAEDFPDDETRRKALREIFGSEDKKAPAADNIRGRVFFMDGLPVSFPKLDLDIMNPHYGDYYQGKTDSKGKPIPPADYLNPVPVTFLTVAEGQTFSFAVYSREKDLADKAREWLIGGLTQLGAGGKTNVGYGYFRIDFSERAEKKIASAPKEDHSLTLRLKAVKNQQTFVEFLKAIKEEEIGELKSVSLKDTVINIGYAESLEQADIHDGLKKIMAEKILDITKPNRRWDEKKQAKYRKLQLLAGNDAV